MKYKNTLLLVFMIFLSTLIYAQTTIRITNGEWEPIVSEYSYQYGFASHIVSEAFRLEGINVEWGFYPWARTYALAQSGEHWDGTIIWWHAEKHIENFFFSDTVMNSALVFYHLKSFEFDWESVDDLVGIEIGATRGYNYGKDFMSAMDDELISVEITSTDEQNFLKMFNGRIKLFPNDSVVGYAQIRNNFSPEEAELFTHHPRKFDLNTLHLLISKNGEHGEFFLEKFNSGLKKLKESGKLDQMYEDLEAGKYDTQKTK